MEKRVNFDHILKICFLLQLIDQSRTYFETSIQRNFSFSHSYFQN